MASYFPGSFGKIQKIHHVHYSISSTALKRHHFEIFAMQMKERSFPPQKGLGVVFWKNTNFGE